MSSSREPESTSTEPPVNQAPSAGAGAVVGRLAVVLLLVAAIWGGVRWVSARALQGRLNAARAELTLAVEQPAVADRRRMAEQALARLGLESRSVAQLSPEEILLGDVAQALINPAGDRTSFLEAGPAPIDRLEFANPATADIGTIQLVARVLLGAGRSAAAGDFAKVALQRPENRPRSLRIAVLAGIALGQEDDVLTYCDEWAKLAPQDPEPWVFKSKVFIDRSYWPQVREALEAALSRNQSDNNVRYHLAAACVEEGDAVAARKELQTLMEACSAGPPDSVQPPVVGAEALQLLEARVLYLEGQLDAARKEAAALAEPPGELTDALLLVARIDLAQQQFASAEQSLQRLLQVDPISHEAHYTLGQVCARQGRKAEAEQHLRRHQELLDDKKRLYELERQAGREPHNMDVRRDLVAGFEALGMQDKADFWRDSIPE